MDLQHLTTSSAYITTASLTKNHYSCDNFCENTGSCSLTGPRMTAVCSCTPSFKGQYCEEPVLWFDFIYKDGKVTGNGFLTMFCLGVSLAITVFIGVIFYRRYKLMKSKTQKKKASNQNDKIFEELHVSSQDQLLVYQVTSSVHPTNSPAPTPCSPQGQGICYLVPTSPEAAGSDTNHWQDFHNPGYRTSYIDSIV